MNFDVPITAEVQYLKDALSTAAGDHIAGSPDTGTDASTTGEVYTMSVAEKVRRAQTNVPAGPELELKPIPQFCKRSLLPRRFFC